MAVRLSTGFRNALCVALPVVRLMDGGTIYLYGGTMPDSPDNPPGEIILGQITTGGATFTPNSEILAAGLRIQWSSPGRVLMSGDWRIKGAANGTVTWFRWCWREYDNHLESTYYPRLDGSIDDVLIMSNPTMTDGRNSPVEFFSLTLPNGS